MLIFKSVDEHYNYLEELIEQKPSVAVITSFGMYAGLTHEGVDLNKVGSKYRTRTKDFLDKLSTVPNVYVLIGLSPYKSCSGTIKCLHCQTSYVKSLLRLIVHCDTFPRFKWRMTENLHAKTFLFTYDADNKNRYEGVLGGRNLNDSNWIDYSFAAEGDIVKAVLKDMINTIQTCDRINNDNINKLLDHYRIEARALELIQI